MSDSEISAWIHANIHNNAIFDEVLTHSLQDILSIAKNARINTDSFSREFLRIAVYGLSANPPHNGHAHIVRQMCGYSSVELQPQYLIKPGEFPKKLISAPQSFPALPDSALDALIVLPVYTHAFAEKSAINSHASYDNRIDMCNLAFSRASSTCPVFVLPFERLAVQCASQSEGCNSGPLVRVGTEYVLRFMHVLFAALPALLFPQEYGIADYADTNACTMEPPIPSLDMNQKCEQIPRFHFELILGEDTAIDLLQGRWINSARMLMSTPLHIFQRNAATPLRLTPTSSAGAGDIDNSVMESEEQAAIRLLALCTALTSEQQQQWHAPRIRVHRLSSDAQVSTASSTVVRQMLAALPRRHKAASLSSGIHYNEDQQSVALTSTPAYHALLRIVPVEVLTYIMDKNLYI